MWNYRLTPSIGNIGNIGHTFMYGSFRLDMGVNVSIFSLIKWFSAALRTLAVACCCLPSCPQPAIRLAAATTRRQNPLTRKNILRGLLFWKAKRISVHPALSPWSAKREWKQHSTSTCTSCTLLAS